MAKARVSPRSNPSKNPPEGSSPKTSPATEPEQPDFVGEVIAKAFPQFTPGKTVEAEWTWEMRQSGSLPPGAHRPQR